MTQEKFPLTKTVKDASSAKHGVCSPGAFWAAEKGEKAAGRTRIGKQM
jgi:hypothetical protein